MAKLPSLKRIVVEDFPPDQQSLISRLAFPINSFFEEVRAALNKSIDFNNLAQDLITLSFSTNENGQPLSQLKFKTSVARVSGVIPISLKIQGNSTGIQITQAPFVTFTQDQSLITISYISGLTPGLNYQINLLVI